MKQITMPLGLQIFSTLVAFFIATPSVQAKTEDLPKLNTVTANILRGGRPTANGLKILQQKKIKTIIDIDDSKSAIETERKNLEKTGIKYYSIPFNSFARPVDANVKKVQDLLNDPSKYPIYIHCKHGEDRTGLMIGLYRVEHGMSPADAYKEMRKLGFHKILRALDAYYTEVTGYDD